jgi:hypothetical protein
MCLTDQDISVADPESGGHPVSDTDTSSVIPGDLFRWGLDQRVRQVKHQQMG